jgi:hypothetical protein
VLFRPLRSFSVFAAMSLATLGLSAIADAAGKDKEAQKLITKAMDEDYLGTDFAKAQKKLEDALKLCGKDQCAPEVVGKIHVALGTVLGLGLNKMPEAQAEFALALKADPKATLDASYQNPDLTKAFEAAKKGGGSKPPKDDGGETPEKPGKTPGGDFNHTPPTEQQVRTPVPIFVEVPDDISAEKVTLSYKPFGGDKWKNVEMTKVGKGWGVEIPCADVTTTGDIKYFIVAKDANGEQLASSGSRKDPYKVPIKQEIEGDSPKLPGKKAPAQCKAVEDCPPGLPGCPGSTPGGGTKGWGASCEATTECQTGMACVNGSCENSEGGSGNGGDGGNETPGAAKPKRNLVGLGIGLDMLVISSAEGVCSGNDPAYVSGNDHVCFYPNDGSSAQSGNQFYGRPATLNGTNGISGGFGIAGGRLLLSYDRQLLKDLGLELGLRLGIAFGGSPSSPTNPFGGSPHDQAKSFLPFHGEARIAYHLGGNSVLEAKKIKPYFFVGGGLAQINASVPVDVCDTLQPDGSAVVNSTKGCRTSKPSRAVSLDAYQITGLNFIGLGGGTVIGITPSFGVDVELKLMIMVPTSGIVFAPSLGPVLAF